MADFQFLPIVRKDSSQLLETCTPYYTESSSKSHDQTPGSSTPQYESILNKLSMNTMVDRTEFLSRDVPMYLPPMVFSRFDLPDKAYLFRPSVAHREGYIDPDIKRPQNLIGTGITIIMFLIQDFSFYLPLYLVLEKNLFVT